MNRKLIYIIILAALFPALITTAVNASKGTHHDTPQVLADNTGTTTSLTTSTTDAPAPSTSATTQPPLSIDCSLTQAGAKVSTVNMTGECNGAFSAAFACKTDTDDLYLTAHATNAAGTAFYLAINVESYKGPGDYDVAEANLITQTPQLFPRWGTAFPVHVDADNSITFVNSVLQSVPGTGAVGTVSLGGHATCGKK